MWLITGGAGFIGSNLADTFLSDGIDVAIVDNLSRTGSAQNLAWLRQRHGKNLVVENFDVADFDAVTAFVGRVRPEAIFHMAGQVAVTTSLADPLLDFSTNVVGTFNLLEAARIHCHAPMFFFASTNKVYGALENLAVAETDTRYQPVDEERQQIDETWPLVGHTPYGCSKLAAEQYVLDYSEQYGLRSVVFRHSSMYGAHQYATFDQGWIGWFCQQALRMQSGDHKPFTIAGNGKQVRDVLNAEDLVAAYKAAVTQIDQVSGKAYNLGGGFNNCLSLLELFSFLETETGAAMHFNKTPARPGDQKYFVADYRSFQRQTGWQPKVDADSGLRTALQWAGTGGLADAR